MTLLDALAAALRDRLLAGHAASLPGVGVFRRRRMTARVEPQPDGSSLLLPPSETVAFEAGSAANDPALAAHLLQHLGTPKADSGTTLRQAVDQLEAHLAAAGEVRLPGFGMMQRSGTEVAFAAAPELLTAVSRPYDGLAPVSTQAADNTMLRPPPPSDASFVDEATLDEDLDDVLGTSDPGRLRAVLPLAPEEPPPAEVPQASDDTQPYIAPPPATPPVPVEPTDSPSPDTMPLAEEAANEWAVLPGKPIQDEDPPPVPEPVPSEPVADNLTQNVAESASTEPDLGWLEEYDADDSESEAEPVLAGASMAAGATASTIAVPPHLPQPAPIIAGPKDPPPKRRAPVWIWMLIPLALLTAVLIWYRSTQPSEPSEPILSAELASEAEPAAAIVDSLDDASVSSAADSASLALDTEAGTDTSVAALPGDDAAALDGEFPVEEMSGAPAGTAPTANASPATPPTSRPTPTRPTPSASPTPTSSTATIDRPDLGGLSEGDREALTSTAPIVSGRGGFSWVVLSTRDRTPADLRARQYRQAGWRVRVFQTEALGDTVYRLAVGQFTSREQADRLRPYLPSQVPSDTWRLDLSTL